MRFITYIFLALWFNSFSQADYIDSTKKFNTSSFGVNASENFTDLGGWVPFWETSAGIFYKRDLLYFSLQCAYTNKVSASNNSSITANLIGPKAKIGLDLFRYKDIFSIPIVFNCSFYNYKFVDKNNPDSQLKLRTYGVKAGIEVKLPKSNISLYGGFGGNYMRFTKSYIDNIGGKISYNFFGIQKTFELEVRYSLLVKKKLRH